MSSITFDKLTYVAKLEASGISREQATAQAEALESALRDTVATKHDIELLRKDMESEFKLYRWAFGIILVAVVYPILKDLFGS